MSKSTITTCNQHCPAKSIGQAIFCVEYGFSPEHEADDQTEICVNVFAQTVAGNEQDSHAEKHWLHFELWVLNSPWAQVEEPLIKEKE